MRPKKPRLTDRHIQAIIAACALVEAGAPEDLTGYDDDESQEKYEAVCAALLWAQEMREYREQRRASKRSRSAKNIRPIGEKGSPSGVLMEKTKHVPHKEGQE